MYRTALRSTPRILNTLRQPSVAAQGRRLASTVPADRRRSWKSSGARWALAIGAVYWYSTGDAFAEEPEFKTIQPPPEFSDEDLPTVEAVVARKRQEAEARARKAATIAGPPESKTAPEPETTALASQASQEAPAREVATGGGKSQQRPPPEEGSPEALEQEASQQGAFNPETGEINWDCPCLGGMADGPCGENFKAAFSCFVYSTEEPKGMDCIEKFQNMQDCFRLHPEIYGEELADDDDAAAAAGGPGDSDGTDASGVAARNASLDGAANANTNANPNASTTETPSPPLSKATTGEVTESNVKKTDKAKPKPKDEKATSTKATSSSTA